MLRNSVRCIALTIPVIALLFSTNRPAVAQFVKSGTTYFVTGDYSLSNNISGNDVVVGKDNSINFATLPGTITLNISSGAKITQHGNYDPDGNYYYGLNVFGTHKVNISGTAEIASLQSTDSSTVTVAGGIFGDIEALSGSTINFSGGTISSLNGWDGSTINFSGGTLSGGYLQGLRSSTLNISGGTLGGVYGEENSTVNLLPGGMVDGYFFSTNHSIDNISGGQLQEVSSARIAVRPIFLRE